MIEWIQNNYQDLLAILGAIYGVATMVAAVTPSDKDDAFLEKLGAWADKIGFKLKGK